MSPSVPPSGSETPKIIRSDFTITSSELDSSPLEWIYKVLPASILANWASVSPFASVPKLITLSLNPVTTTLPSPHVDDELSANATEVTASSITRFKFPVPNVIFPILDWFLLIL